MIYGANKIGRLKSDVMITEDPTLFIINRPWLVPGYKEIMANIKNHEHKKISKFAGFDLYLFNEK